MLRVILKCTITISWSSNNRCSFRTRGRATRTKICKGVLNCYLMPCRLFRMPTRLRKHSGRMFKVTIDKMLTTKQLVTICLLQMLLYTKILIIQPLKILGINSLPKQLWTKSFVRIIIKLWRKSTTSPNNLSLILRQEPVELYWTVQIMENHHIINLTRSMRRYQKLLNDNLINLARILEFTIKINLN